MSFFLNRDNYVFNFKNIYKYAKNHDGHGADKFILKKYRKRFKSGAYVILKIVFNIYNLKNGGLFWSI